MSGMKRHLAHFPFALLCAAICTLVAGEAAVLMYSTAPAQVQASTGSNAGLLTGYAWSENIGWISFNGANYGVFVSPSDGKTLTGYAWSSNIGWISFNAADTSSCGSGGATLAGTKPLVSLSGWARAIAGGTSSAGGWDGCISLAGSGYGAQAGSYSQAGGGGLLQGYAWGSSVVGWVQFDPAQGGVHLLLKECDNNLDDDSDTFIDLSDPQCADRTGDSEGLIDVAGPPGTVDIKVNGQDSARIRKGNTVTVTWTSTNEGGCVLSTPSGTSAVEAQNTAGTPFTVSTASLFTLTCNDIDSTGAPTGPARNDSVLIQFIPEYQEI
jgi:hypothetical protein